MQENKWILCMEIKDAARQNLFSSGERVPVPSRCPLFLLKKKGREFELKSVRLVKVCISYCLN